MDRSDLFLPARGFLSVHISRTALASAGSAVVKRKRVAHKEKSKRITPGSDKTVAIAATKLTSLAAEQSCSQHVAASSSVVFQSLLSEVAKTAELEIWANRPLARFPPGGNLFFWGEQRVDIVALCVHYKCIKEKQSLLVLSR